MKEIVLNTMSSVHYNELVQILTSQGIDVVEREHKQSQTKEVMFYYSPECFLAVPNALEQTDQQRLSEWKHQSDIYIRNVVADPQNCVLIDLSWASAHPEDFAHYLQLELGITYPEQEPSYFDPVLLIEKCLLLIEEDEIQEAYEDLTASADFFNNMLNISVMERLGTYKSALQKELLLNSSERNQLSDELESTKKQLVSEKTRLEAEVEKLSSANSQLQTGHDETRGENELALLQVAQLQEELEASFISKTELENSKKELAAEKTRLEAEVEKLSSANSQLQTEHDETRDENELALLQIAQLQEELEHYFIKSQENRSVPFNESGGSLSISRISSSLELVKVLNSQVLQ